MTWFLSVDRFRAPSDFDEKLVTSWSVLDVTPACVLLGTVIWASGDPEGVSSWRTRGDVTPKLPSTEVLLKTYGYWPPATAVLHGSNVLPHPGGSCVVPATMLASGT